MSIFEIKHINQFIYNSDKDSGSSTGEIYVLKSEQEHNLKTKYLIKTSLSSTGVVNEFVASYILRQIIGDRAPENYLVKLDDKDTLGIASKFIPGYITSSNYFSGSYNEAQYKDSLAKATEYDIWTSYSIVSSPLNPQQFTPLSCEDYSIEVATNILGDFIGHKDFHDYNNGVVISNENTANAALIDFDNSLGANDLLRLKEVLPYVQYYTGVKDALGLLRLIKQKFALSSLDKLNNLFNSSILIYELDRVKQFMENKLEEVDLQILIGELALKLENDTISEEEYSSLINSNFVLERFTLKDGKSNPLADNICKMAGKMGDLTPIANMINKDNFPISALVKYYYISKNNELLWNLISLLKENKKIEFIKEIIHQSHNLDELNIALELIQANNIKVKGLDETIKCLTTDCYNIEKLFDHLFYRDTIETELTLKIIINGLRDSKFIKFDFEGWKTDDILYYTYETLYRANDIDTLTKLVKAKSVDYFFYFIKGVIHSKNLPFAQFVLNQLTDIDEIKKYAIIDVRAVNHVLKELEYHQSFREEVCNLFKNRIEELGYSFLEQDLVLGSSAKTYHCNDILIGSITHDEL